MSLSYVEAIQNKAKDKAPKISKEERLALENDTHFSLGKDGDFYCNNRPYPDFKNKETIESMVNMMRFVEEVRASNPKKKILLHYDDKDSKLELTERTSPSIIMAVINNSRPNGQEGADKDRTEKLIGRSMVHAVNADLDFAEMLKEQRAKNSSSVPTR